MCHKSGEKSIVDNRLTSHAENSPITFHPVTFLHKNFWSNIIRCANSGISLQHLYIQNYKHTQEKVKKQFLKHMKQRKASSIQILSTVETSHFCFLFFIFGWEGREEA